MARGRAAEVTVFGEQVLPSRGGSDGLSSLFSDGSVTDATVQIVARPAPFTCLIQMIALRLEESPGACGASLPPPEAIRLHIGCFSVQSGGLFGGDVGTLKSAGTVALIGVDPHSREPQTIEVSPPLTILRGHHVGLINIAGGSLNLMYECRDLIWRGDRNQGYLTWSWPGGNLGSQGIAGSLARGVTLSTQFRYRSSWWCIGHSGLDALKDPQLAQESVSGAARKAIDLEPIIRMATADEIEEKLRQLLVEQETIVGELVLDELPPHLAETI